MTNIFLDTVWIVLNIYREGSAFDFAAIKIDFVNYLCLWKQTKFETPYI